MTSNLTRTLEVDLPLDTVIERLTHGARLRSGAAWPTARSAVFSLGQCSIGVEAKAVGNRTEIAWGIDEGCANFAPFAEQEIKIILSDEATQARKRWLWLLGVGVGCLVGVFLLAR